MRESTLARGITTVLCGLWLCGFPSMAQETEEPEERVKTVRLVAGEMQIVTTYKADEKNAKVRFRGQEFDLGYGDALHHKTFRLRDREIVIVETLGNVRGMPPSHDVLSVSTRGSVKHIKNIEFSTSDGTFFATQALGGCIDNIDKTCEQIEHSMSTVRGLSSMAHNPRWKIAGGRFDATCKRTCKAKKRSTYAEFAKHVCGP